MSLAFAKTRSSCPSVGIETDRKADKPFAVGAGAEGSLGGVASVLPSCSSGSGSMAGWVRPCARGLRDPSSSSNTPPGGARMRGAGATRLISKLDFLLEPSLELGGREVQKVGESEGRRRAPQTESWEGDREEGWRRGRAERALRKHARHYAGGRAAGRTISSSSPRRGRVPEGAQRKRKQLQRTHLTLRYGPLIACARSSSRDTMTRERLTQRKATASA